MTARPMRRKKLNSRMKYLLLSVFVVICVLWVDSSYAQNVRGMLIRQGYAAPNVAVTLLAPHTGRSSPAYTGANGMYYFYNVLPGNYTLEIWGYGNIPTTYFIQVGSQPYTDILPIAIP